MFLKDKIDLLKYTNNLKKLWKDIHSWKRTTTH